MDGLNSKAPVEVHTPNIVNIDIKTVEKACDRMRLIVLNKGEIDPNN